MTYTLSNEAHKELVELIEDSVSHFCDQNKISGELTWLVIQCLSTAKIEQLKGNIK